MAITVKRNKKGTMDTTYSGFDAVSHNFGSALEKIKSGVRKVGNAIAEPHRRKAQYDAKNELDNITRAFGSVEKYEKLYPETAKRHAELRKRAYGTK